MSILSQRQCQVERREMIVEHVATCSNQRELGECLGKKVVMVSQRSWTRLRAYLEKCERLGVLGFDWELNVVVCDFDDDFESEE